MKTKYHSTLSTSDAKGGDQTRNNSIRRRWSALALGGCLFTSVLALSASAVEAKCEGGGWDVSGKWQINQSMTSVFLDLRQAGTKITGTAKGLAADVGGATVTGTVKGDDITLQIVWTKQALISTYAGKIGDNGSIEGKELQGAVGWSSSRDMTCDPRGATTPKVLKRTGRRPTNTTPPETAPPQTQASTASPTISANPRVVTIPDGQSQGTVTLTWDGGPDHPYAEVWVQVGGRDATFVVEQGKGTRSMTVERGKNYLFSLTDAGQQLAKAVVISKR